MTRLLDMQVEMANSLMGNGGGGGGGGGLNGNGNGNANGARGKKLHGREFYESIGSPKFVLAPMVDQSEFAWRMLSRSFMDPNQEKGLLAYTPMFHARMFSETPKFRDTHFQPLRESLLSHPEPESEIQIETKGEPYLDGHPSLDRPLFVQFCANNPDELLNAAKFVTPYCDAVDLNLGCPQGIARKGKYGAFLQEDQDLIGDLINKLHLELDVPVTAKIRILETKEKTLEYAKKVLDAGASILTVHGRTREMKGHKTGLADWGVIRFLRENLPGGTVLFANGNVLRREDIERCIRETGVDGVMSAEGNLYDPSIFGTVPEVGMEGREYWRGRDGKGGWRMDAVFRRYMDVLYKYVLEVPVPERRPLYIPSDDPLEFPAAETDIPAANGVAEAKEEETSQPPRKKQKLDDTTTTIPPIITANSKGKTPKAKKEKTTSPNLLAMQPHLFRLLRPLVKRHTGIRDALAKSRAGDIDAFENVLSMVQKVCMEGIKEYERTDGESWEAERVEEEREMIGKLKLGDGEGGGNGGEGGEGEGFEESSIETVRGCKRPWWVVQAHVRPLPREALAKGSLTLSKKERAKLEMEKVGGGQEGKLDEKVEGKVEVEKVSEDVGSIAEEIEIPKEGLVCG